LELRLGLLVAGVAVGVVLPRQAAVRLLDRVLRGVAGDTEDLVVVAGHGRSADSECLGTRTGRGSRFILAPRRGPAKRVRRGAALGTPIAPSSPQGEPHRPAVRPLFIPLPGGPAPRLSRHAGTSTPARGVSPVPVREATKHAFDIDVVMDRVREA